MPEQMEKLFTQLFDKYSREPAPFEDEAPQGQFRDDWLHAR